MPRDDDYYDLQEQVWELKRKVSWLEETVRELRALVTPLDPGPPNEGGDT